jgi:hypothetical protein
LNGLFSLVGGGRLIVRPEFPFKTKRFQLGHSFQIHIRRLAFPNQRALATAWQLASQEWL